MFTLLMVASVQLNTAESGSRVFDAFSQHYAGQQVFLDSIGLDDPEITEEFNPWFDYEMLVARDFPGADSLSSAFFTAPLRVSAYLLIGGFRALFMGWVGLGFGGLRTIAIPVFIALAVWFFTSGRFRRTAQESDSPLADHQVSRKGMYLTCLGFCATSAAAPLIWSTGRHVIGITVALMIWFTWLVISRASQTVRTKAPVAIMLVATVFLMLTAAYRVSQVHRRPHLHLISQLDAAVGDRPVTLGGRIATSVCGYLPTDGCKVVVNPQEDACAWFDVGAHYIVERLGVIDDAVCGARAAGYQRLTWTDAYDVRQRISSSDD